MLTAATLFSDSFFRGQRLEVIPRSETGPPPLAPPQPRLPPSQPRNLAHSSSAHASTAQTAQYSYHQPATMPRALTAFSNGGSSSDHPQQPHASFASSSRSLGFGPPSVRAPLPQTQASLSADLMAAFEAQLKQADPTTLSVLLSLSFLASGPPD